MIAIRSRESVIQNLEDAGCENEMIQDFLGWFDKGQQTKQLELLEHQREYLLGRVPGLSDLSDSGKAGRKRRTSIHFIILWTVYLFPEYQKKR